MDVSTLINGSKAAGTAGASAAAQKAQETQDRFLTLLVAQMKNQDPMNPMENAELTTQIAQIQTVTGVDKLNTSIESLAKSFGQSQVLQGVALVGRDVTLEGNRMVNKADHAEGSFELGGAADQVMVQVTTAAGTVIDTVNLGAATGGRHDFTWSKAGYDASSELHFKVVATRGAKPISATTFSRDTVVSISTRDGQLGVQLASGNTVGYDSIFSVD